MEEAQELTVANAGQPATVDIAAVTTPVEVAQELLAVVAATQIDIELAPAMD